MTARDRIDAAVVIARAVLRTPIGLGSDDTAKAIAVALESEGLLVDRAAMERELRVKLATEIDAAIEELFESGVGGLERRMGLRQAYAIVLLRNHPAADEAAQVAVADPSERRRPERFPGERSARRMLRESGAFDPADPAGGA